MTGKRFVIAAAALLAWAPPLYAADTAKVDGRWEGPWYRGMTSGTAVFEISGGGGTLQLTNSETFGDDPKPLKKVEFDGRSFAFQADGGGGALGAVLDLNERGDQLKGMGKYEGFTVRFELKRATR
jgi:hypothetical protein